MDLYSRDLAKFANFLTRYLHLQSVPDWVQSPKTYSLIRETLNLWKGNAVIDADALRSDIIEKVSRPERLILTPHSGEFKRISITESVSEYSSRTGSIVIYKEPHTQIVSSKKTVFAFSGSSLLARGGSGDLLTGIIGSLVAKNFYDLFDSALLGVLWHGRAAEVLGTPAWTGGSKCD